MVNFIKPTLLISTGPSLGGPRCSQSFNQPIARPGDARLCLGMREGSFGSYGPFVSLLFTVEEGGAWSTASPHPVPS